MNIEARAITMEPILIVIPILFEVEKGFFHELFLILLLFLDSSLEMDFRRANMQ